MSITDELLAPFTPVTLREMDAVKLLNRMDAKFVFSAGLLPALLGQLVSSYHILEIGTVRQQHYETLYFDTPGNRLYLDHHNRRLNRFKVRSRRYLDSGDLFFEIKFKSNKGRTRKERIRHAEPWDRIGSKQEELLAAGTGFSPEMLRPSLMVSFSRITLAGKEMAERVTIDTGLSFRNDTGRMEYPGIAIAEVKQDRSCRSVITGVLHGMHVPPTRVSKYCIGLASVHPGLKQNYFKQKLHLINKLNHGCA